MIYVDGITEGLKGLFLVAKEIKFKNHELVVGYGDIIQFAFCLCKGLLRVYRVKANGDTLTVGWHKSVTMFPLIPIIGRVPSAFCYEVVGEAIAKKVPVRTLWEYLESHHQDYIDLCTKTIAGGSAWIEKLE